MRALLPVLALALAAGCVATSVDPSSVVADVSQPIYELESALLERIGFEADDGTYLDVVVWRPDTTEKVPVIADIGPYFTDIMNYEAIDLRLAEYFVPRGYAVARASVRGTGESEGCFGLGDERERKDVAQTVEWLGAQPWSNGNVGVFGKSYDGTTPWMAALEQPPALKTIIPISGLTDWYRYVLYDGVAYQETAGFNTYYYLSVDWDLNPFAPFSLLDDPTSPPSPLKMTDPEHILTKNVLRTCEMLVPQTLPLAQSYATGDHDHPFWNERNYEPLLSQVDVPVFMVHGFQDWNVKPDNQLPFYASLDVPKALWVGQWEHDYPDINRFNDEWSRHDWNETLLVWFDHWLKGVENDWERLAHVESQDQTGTWRNWTTWPPAEARELALHLGDGTLSPEPAPAWAGSFGGPYGATLELATEPLAEDILVAGIPVLDLQLSADRPLGHVTVKLLDEAPDGTRTEVDHGARDIRHRDGRDRGAPAPVGEAFAMNVTLYPQEIMFAKGHKIVLVLAAEDPDWYLPSASGAASFVLDAGEGRAVLRLPVVARETMI